MNTNIFSKIDANVQQMESSEYIHLRNWYPHTDSDQVSTLMASMQANGWLGAPIVIWEQHYLALTGQHRLAAAIGNYFDSYTPAILDYIPTICIANLCDAAGVDFEEILEEHGFTEQAQQDFRCCTWEYSDLMIAVIRQLPQSLVRYYGLDYH